MYQRILVAIDDSVMAESIFKEALELTKIHHATLKALHVADASFLDAGWSISDEVRQSLLKRGQEILTQMENFAKNAGLQIETELMELTTAQYRVADLIISAAKDWQADLLVIGTHGRRGLSRLFLGSVAANVVRMIDIPILLLRGK